MTFAATPQQLIGTIESVLGHDDFDRADYKNDGAHEYLYIQEESKTQLPVTNKATQIQMPLTSANLDVVQFDKSFITLTVEATFPIEGWSEEPSDDSTNALTKNLRHALDMFIGLKHASDAMEKYTILHKDRTVAGMVQDHATLESFLYHSYRGEADLKNRRGTHTIARAVEKDDLNSVCGEYVTLEELLIAHGNNDKITKTFTFIIPFNDILIFQQFKDYPSELFGSLDIKFNFNPSAFIYKQCKERDCIESSIIRNNMKRNESGSLAYLSNDKWGVRFDIEYAQIGDSIRAITNATTSSATATSATYSTGKVTIGTPTIKIVEAFSTICGYKMKDSLKDKLRDKYRHQEWCKFTQRVTAQQFNTSLGGGTGFVTQQIAFDNVTDMIVLFPRSTNEVFGTVYKNPMLDNVYISAFGRKYPDMPLDTSSARCAQIMLNASDMLHAEPLREYADSISIYRYDASGKVLPSTDLTTYFLTLKTERPSAMGMIMDGLDSEGKLVGVRLSGRAKYNDPDLDEYATKNPPNPILVLVSDAYIMFTSDSGGTCHFGTKDLYKDQANIDDVD